tara:strand:- start:814 stop:1257 length:444 start_codon:yes stop_codon:yes gene_type:complete
MNIIFQRKDFSVKKQIDQFSKNNKNSGAMFSFIGKVRNKKNGQVILSIDIEFYEKMALFQIKKIIRKLEQKYPITNYLVIHRFGNLKPGENILLILVSSKHRKQGFRFAEELIDWLKIKVTFWKKENFLRNSEWVSQKESDRLISDI